MYTFVAVNACGKLNYPFFDFHTLCKITLFTWTFITPYLIDICIAGRVL